MRRVVNSDQTSASCQATVALEGMREGRELCIGFVEICFHRLVVMARTRDLQLTLNKTPVMSVQYFKAKNNSQVSQEDFDCLCNFNHNFLY